jgi:hypothetical protein
MAPPHRRTTAQVESQAPFNQLVAFLESEFNRGATFFSQERLSRPRDVQAAEESNESGTMPTENETGEGRWVLIVNELD